MTFVTPGETARQSTHRSAVPAQGAGDRSEPLLPPTVDAALEAVADVLHDGLLQDLVAARYLLDLMDGSHATWADDPKVAELANAVRGALEQARDLMASTRAHSRDGKGLTEALTELAARCAVPSELTVDLPEELEPAVAVTAYRLVQAVIGASRAATAEQISIHADTRAARLRVTAVITGSCDVSWAPSWEHHLRSFGGSLVVDQLPEGVRLSATIVMEGRQS